MATLLKINWKCNLWLVCALVACSPETVDYGMGEYYAEIVTALENNAFLLDTGQTIRDHNKTARQSFAPGDRVYLSFSYEKDPPDAVKVHGAKKIFSDTLQITPESAIHQQKNDPIRLESAWIGSRYLNLKFYMEYHSEAHKIALLTDAEHRSDPEIHLYFRHDKNNDAPGYLTPIYASYNLAEILGEPQGMQTLFVHFNTTNYGNKTCTLPY
jgi:hypothetical protein